jgi:5-methylcytosine-specific restriction protein A
VNKTICNIDGCPNKGKYCRLHLSYTVPVKSEINKVSDDHKETLKEYKKIRAAFLKKHPMCMAKLNGCTGKATECHHMAGKATRDLYLNDKLFLAVCHSCHKIIEKNPAFSKQQGLSVSRLAKIKALK